MHSLSILPNLRTLSCGPKELGDTGVLQTLFGTSPYDGRDVFRIKNAAQGYFGDVSKSVSPTLHCVEFPMSCYDHLGTGTLGIHGFQILESLRHRGIPYFALFSTGTHKACARIFPATLETLTITISSEDASRTAYIDESLLEFNLLEKSALPRLRKITVVRHVDNRNKVHVSGGIRRGAHAHIARGTGRDQGTSEEEISAIGSGCEKGSDDGIELEAIGVKWDAVRSEARDAFFERKKNLWSISLSVRSHEKWKLSFGAFAGK
jgi:hypothetical protein